jgi:phospholipid transport system transporter-binding protein
VSPATLTATGPGLFRLAGNLDFGSVGTLLAEGEGRFAGHPTIRIDLQAVTQANSAGLALLLEWLDQAQRGKQRVELINLPESLMRIAAITNLAGLLPLGADAAPPRT